MGNTLWILTNKREDDDWDHSLILKEEKALNKLADTLGVPKISDYYDFSILQGEYGVEVEPTRIVPDEAERIFQTILSAIQDGRAGKLKRCDEIAEELTDCLEKIRHAKQSGEQVRLAIVS